MSQLEGKSRTINLGTSQEISIGDLVHQIGEILGAKLQVSQDAARRRPVGSEMERLVSDNRLAREVLGWQPKVSLHDGLRQTVEWISKHLDLYRVGRYEI